MNEKRTEMNSMEIKNVVVFGAGGQVGKNVLRHLLASPEFIVTILTREDSTSTFPQDVKVIITDFSAESLAAALKNQDAVISTVTHMAFDKQALVLKAAVTAGIRRFLPSDYGADTSCEALLQAAPFTRSKRNVTEELKRLQGQGPEGKFSWTSIVTGPFLEWCVLSGEFGFDTKARTAILYDDVPFATSKLDTIGGFVVGVLRNPELSKNRYLYVRSALATQRQLLVELQKITGDEWTVTEKSSKEKRQEGLERIESGDFMGNLDLIEAAIVTKGTGFDFESMNAEFGVSGDEDISQLVRDIWP